MRSPTTHVPERWDEPDRIEVGLRAGMALHAENHGLVRQRVAGLVGNAPWKPSQPGWRVIFDDAGIAATMSWSVARWAVDA